MGTESGPMFWFFVPAAHSPSLQSGEADCSDVSSVLHGVGLSGVKNTRPSLRSEPLIMVAAWENL